MQFSLIEWLMGTSIAVKLIIAVLFVLSLLSWSIIFSKLWQLKTIKIKQYSKNLQFEPNLNAIHQNFDYNNKNQAESLIHCAVSAFNQYKHQPLNIQLDNTERSMYIKIDENFSNYSKNLALLSSIANVSPYIGLLGTVIGIMHTFLNLGDASGIAQIAPSIAESLVVTALGLIVAIPASFAYNYFADKISDIQSTFFTLKDRIINLLTLSNSN